MQKGDKRYDAYLKVLKEELRPAMGCTEPIAIAYAAAVSRQYLGVLPDRIDVYVSGSIIKNVKSVIIPNTNGLKGIEAAAAAGVVAGAADKKLEVISEVSPESINEINNYIKNHEIKVIHKESSCIFDILIVSEAGGHNTKVRIVNTHTNIVQIEKDDEIIMQIPFDADKNDDNEEFMSIKTIWEFANIVSIEDISEILDKQIEYNMTIAEEGMKHIYGANIGKVINRMYDGNIKNKAKSMAAAGSDARMGGCELPVIINSGSGNQGITASVPVIVYARELKVKDEALYRALVLSNLIAIYQKRGIGTLSAYCGVVSAGAGSGAGIAYLQGGDLEDIEHTVVNALAIVSGIVCDGAKPSCAAKIAASVDAGIMGYNMYKCGQQFYAGEGIVNRSIDTTIENVSRLGKEGMKATNEEIIKIMIE